MSYGTRKAIAGGMKATELAIKQSEVVIGWFDECKTIGDMRSVLEKMKGMDFFFLPSENEKNMRVAFDRAKERTEVKL